MADQQPITDSQSLNLGGSVDVPSVDDNPIGGQDDNQRILARQTPSGISRGVQQLGGPSLSADSGNKQITVTDDVPQVLMGSQPNFGEGFYVTKQGIDVTSTAKVEDFIFNSNQNVFKIVATDTRSIDFIDSPASVATLAHGLNFAPIPMAFLVNVGDGTAYGNFPFPVTLAYDTVSVPGTILPVAQVRVAADNVNIYFEVFNVSGLDLGTFQVRYYLLQETSGVLE